MYYFFCIELINRRVELLMNDIFNHDFEGAVWLGEEKGKGER